MTGATESQSELQWARVLLDVLEEGFTLQGPAGEILAANPAAERILGLTRDQLAGRSSLDPRWRAVHEDGTDWPGDTHPAMVTLQTGTPVTGALMGVHRPDGSLVWIEVSSTALEAGPDGRPTGVVTSFSDVTVSRETGEQARRHRRLLATVLAQMRVGVLVEAAQGTVDLTNAAFCRLFGIPLAAEELVGLELRAAYALAPEIADLDAYVARTAELVAAGVDVHGEQLRLADGRVLERDLHLIDSTGGRREVVWIFRDVSEHVHAEQVLARARDAAVEASRAKSDFLATLSHEVRTPVSGIVGMVDLMLAQPLEDDLREIVEGVRASADGLTALLEDMLDLVRIEAGRLDLAEAPFDPREVAERCVEVFANGARGKRLRLVCGIADEVPTRVLGDAGRLRQVLLNLVGNAVKFTEHGEVVLDVTATPSGRVRFEVSDTGPGLGTEVRERVFHPFVQAQTPTAAGHGGSGLGLAIAQRLVSLMQGQLEVSSVTGRGSVFTVLLPLAAAPGTPPRPSGTERPLDGPLAGIRVEVAAPETAAARVLTRTLAEAGAQVTRTGETPDVVVGLDDTSEPDAPARASRLRARTGAPRVVVLSTADAPRDWPSGEASVVALPASRERLLRAVLGQPRQARAVELEQFSAGRVLLAEDNLVNRTVIARMVQALGVTCDTADNGEQAVTAALSRPYDVILMDVNMPVLDGPDATRVLHGREQGRATPVLALTAATAAEDRQRCREAGMTGFLTKPVAIRDLRDALAAYLPTRTRAQSEAPALDPRRLTDLVDQLGDAGAVKEVVQTYLDGLDGRWQEAGAALAAGDRQTLRLVAHSLKSSSAMLGAVALSALCQELESSAAVGGPADLRRGLDEGQELGRLTRAALEGWLAQS